MISISFDIKWQNLCSHPGSAFIFCVTSAEYFISLSIYFLCKAESFRFSSLTEIMHQQLSIVGQLIVLKKQEAQKSDFSKSCPEVPCARWSCNARPVFYIIFAHQLCNIVTGVASQLLGCVYASLLNVLSNSLCFLIAIWAFLP